MSQKRYRCAIITGASAGLGEEFARQIAPDAERLVLAARRTEKLEALRAELSGNGTEVICVTADLADAVGREVIVEVAEGFAVDLLVNNAGLGDYGDFLGAEWAKTDLMLQVNMVALTHLCHAVTPLMIKSGGGGIINVSSLASTLPIPDFAAYAATKAYVSSFSEALRIELREQGVKVTAVCPGPVHTEFGDVAAREHGTKDFGPREMIYVEKEQVVSNALKALRNDKARVFPGWVIAAAGRGIAALPMPVVRFIMGRRPRRMLPESP